MTDEQTPDPRFQVVTGYGDQRATVADFLSRDRAQAYADEVNASYQRDDFRVREVTP